MNTFAIRHVWEAGVEPVTPTVFIFERTILRRGGRYLVADETRLLPLVGRSAIASLSDSILRQIYLPTSHAGNATTTSARLR
jgi:hypothetical protein